MEVELLIPIILFSIFISVGLGLAIWAVVASQDALQQLTTKASLAELVASDAGTAKEFERIESVTVLSFSNLNVIRSADLQVVAQTNIEFNIGGLGQSSCKISSFEVTTGTSTDNVFIDFDFGQLPSSFKTFSSNAPINNFSLPNAPGVIIFDKENNKIIITSQPVSDGNQTINGILLPSFGLTNTIVYFNLL